MSPKYYQVKVGNYAVDESELSHPIGQEDIHFVLLLLVLVEAWKNIIRSSTDWFSIFIRCKFSFKRRFWFQRQVFS